ncbi:hypothetical protein ELI38_18820 [Rhizobium leguminosarum]|nr:hypothetical protein [Rhizobium leguminosarum bv. phaseoli]NKK92418.1 hypothetical protein [Rhizobium leguminosarum bv. viciae]TAU99152.1 hypothetical protein ELI38_18820 [Rhizobium leguminosarum]TAW54800.1 hypothetical protein ELI14_20810 [Rhizobium leguminosarum]TAX53724.1 hypothetical protein ELH99_21010 [Rhizobium leguminosarum]
MPGARHVLPELGGCPPRRFAGRSLMKIRTGLVLVGAAAALAACVSSEPRQRLAAVAPPVTNSVEGAWADANGLTSTFTSGQFVTRTNDGTNTQMASGTYTTTPDGIIQINLYSNIKRTNSLVNCALIGSTQLNCTTATGSQFTLSRRG